MIQNPFKLLFAHQRDWVLDQSRFKLWVKSRQIGGSFAAAFEIVEECFRKPNTTWIIVSASEKLSKEFLENAKKVIRIMLPALNLENKNKFPEPIMNKSEIYFAGNSRVISLSANPRTARSFSGNLLLDEFAFHEHPEEIWGAVYPTITNPLKSELKVRVISTPNGKNNKFYDLWANDDTIFNKHRTTIHEAKDQGFSIDIETIRRGFDSEKKWQQEYECVFLSDAGEETIFTDAIITGAVNAAPVNRGGWIFAYVDLAARRDENVLAVMVGDEILPLHCWVCGDNENPEDHLIFLFNKYKETHGLTPEVIWGDEGGAGGITTINRLHSLGWPINRIQNGWPSYEPSRYANLGAEIWMKAKMILAEKQVKIPKDPKLHAQLSRRNCKFNERGKVQLESKKDLSKSPDRADAVCGVIYCARHLAHPISNGSLSFNEQWDELMYPEKTREHAGFNAGG